MRSYKVVRITPVALALALLGSALIAEHAYGQSWSAEEQEVIEHLRACWSTWASEDYDTWVQVCNLDPSGSYWDTNDLSPLSIDPGSAYHRSVVEEGFRQRDVVAWDIRPVSITSWGDVVGVYFFSVLHLRDAQGQVTMVQDRRFEVVRKVDGAWSVAGGMSVILPSST